MDPHAPAPPPAEAAKAEPVKVDQDGFKCTLVDGKIDGDMHHTTGGDDAVRIGFKNGKLHGRMEVRGDDGELVQTCDYEDGVPHGALKVFVNGKCVANQTFVKGVLEGLSTSYDLAGLVAAKILFKNGQMTGPSEFFYEGRKVRRAMYRDGLLEGEAIDYDRDGKMVQKCLYKGNVLHGKVQRYWPSGELMEEQPYKDGVPQAPPQRFDPKGKRTDPDGQPPPWIERLQRAVRGDGG